jgi:hypothetical protein
MISFKTQDEQHSSKTTTCISARSGLERLGEPVPFRHLTRMPTTKLWSSADLDAVIARVTPDIVALLGDGMPRAEAAIMAALAGRHPKGEVKLTVMRLDVVGRLDLQDGRYTLPAAEAGQQG